MYLHSILLVYLLRGSGYQLIRVNPAKEHPAEVFTESTVVLSSSSLPRLMVMWKRRKYLILARSRGRAPSSRCRSPVAWHTTTVLASSSESATLVSCFIFSIPSPHLLNHVSIDVLIESSRFLDSLLVTAQRPSLVLQRLPHILCVVPDAIL